MIRMISGFLLLIASFAQGAALYKAKPIGSGYLECPAELRATDKGKTIYCDLSAAVYARGSGKIYYAADWWGQTKRSKLFSMKWTKGAPSQDTRTYHVNSLSFTDIEKVEAMSKTEDGRYLIASGSFTHSVDTGYADWMKINSLVYWPDGLVSAAAKPDLMVAGKRILVESIDETEYTYHLRNGMLDAIQSRYPDTVFFKVEGLSALPGNRLAFGVREIGVHYTNTDYKSIILTTSYKIESGRLTIGTDFKLLHDFALNKNYTLAGDVGVSSIEYDFDRHLLYMVTSYEKDIGGTGKGSDEDIGAYVWVIPMGKASKQLLLPRLVRNQKSIPYQFAHKAEAMVIDAQGQIILIADDDKVLGRAAEEIYFPETQFSRKPWEAAYTVLRITPGNAKTALPH